MAVKKTPPSRLLASRFVAAALWAAIVAAPCVAKAEPSAADRSVAQALFDDAKRLMGEKNYASACPKFAESQRLDPGMGTLFRLSQCQELLGQTASAWSGYIDVAGLARSAGQGKREEAARAEAARLEPTLSRLSIVVAPGVTGVEVKRDGVVVGQAQWGLTVPIDPGTHTIDATAPGKKPWHASVPVTKPGATVTVTVPALENAPIVPVAPVASATAGPGGADGPGAAAPPDVPNPARTRRVIIGATTAGVGLVGVAVGSYFGIDAINKLKDSNAGHCIAGTTRCTATGVTLRAESVSSANLATALFAVGGTALVAGVIIWATAPGKASPTKKAQTSYPFSPATLGLAISPSQLGFQGTW